MKVTNTGAKGKWVHVKINGYSYKKWVAAYGSVTLPEVTSRSQLNLNAHEESMIHAEDHGQIFPKPIPPEFYYTINATRLGTTGGTTSLSASSVSVAKGMSLSFSVYPESNYYLSAYTVNGIAQGRSTPSATTVYTLSNIVQDENISVAFATFGS